MKLSDRDAFYEKMYFHEIAERDRLGERFRTLLVILGIVFTIIGYLFHTVVIQTDTTPLLFWIIYAVAVISFVAAVTCYLKAWHSQYYNEFPTLEDIELYINQIRLHYAGQTDESTSAQWTEEAFEHFMRQSFIEHTSFNALANDSKRFWLYYGNSFIISAFIFAVMAFVPIAETFLPT